MTRKKQGSGEGPRERIVEAARGLFGQNGFHATTTDKLALVASVSVGQIYRHFSGKDDIVLAIVEENTRARVAQIHEIFDAVECAQLSMFDAIRAIAKASLQDSDAGLVFEIFAEAVRNRSVAERLETLMAFYRDGIRRLARRARPDAPEAELEACVDVMVACFIGLGHRTAIAPCTDVESTSENTACVMMRALGLSAAVGLS